MRKYLRLYKETELGELTVTENGTYEPSKASGMYGYTSVTVNTPENPIAMTESNISEIAGAEKYRNMFVSYNGNTYKVVAAGTAGAEQLYPSGTNAFLPYYTTTDATATPGDILSGKTAYVNGGKTTGTMTDNSDVEQITVTNPSGNYVPKGYYADIRTQLICQGAQNIVPENIKNGVSFLGVTGTLSASPEYDFATDSLIMSADSSFYEPIDDINVSLTDGFTVTCNLTYADAAGNCVVYESDTYREYPLPDDKHLVYSFVPEQSSAATASFDVTITKKYMYITPAGTAVANSSTSTGGVTILSDGGGGLIICEVTGNGSVSFSSECLTGDTLVTMSDYSTKRLDEIELGDSVLSFDFDTNELIAREVIYTDKDENKSHTEYDKWTFDDGTVIKTVHRHEFYNVEAQRMKYMDEWNIGEHIYKIDGTKPMLIDHETVKETVNHYKITLDGSTNYFANGLLNGDRYCPKNIKL